MKIEISVIDTENKFKFRLVNGAKATEWVGYEGVVGLDGMYAATAYYLPAHLTLKPLTAEEFMRAWIRS